MVGASAQRAPAPSCPPAIRPLLFYGVADAGAVVEVRGTKDEELEVHVDGALTERVAAGKDLSTATPPLSFRVDGITAHETFTASAEALDALADFLDDEGNRVDGAPWQAVTTRLSRGAPASDRLELGLANPFEPRRARHS